ERAGFSDAALKHAKQLRVQALNEAFAAGGVLKDSDEETKPKSEPPAKEAPPKKRPAFPLHFTLRTIALANSIRIPPASAHSLDGSLETRMLESSPLQIAGDYLTEEEDDHV